MLSTIYFGDAIRQAESRSFSLGETRKGRRYRFKRRVYAPGNKGFLPIGDWYQALPRAVD
ncbi:MAG: hypothetical protein DSM106950_20345 [Stigonema ocellatum SAG 48.90 = DSM 106950]|nr:hypothetical protein [Stigonema ocellatum SAG 48.90 = DSM 106950]